MCLNLAEKYNCGGPKPYQFTSDEMIEFLHTIRTEDSFRLAKLEAELRLLSTQTGVVLNKFGNISKVKEG